MSFNPGALIDSLHSFSRILPTLVDRLGEDDAHWRPDDRSWSIVEIVRHLADEEVEDFRPRLEHILTDPEAEWAPINPEGWARDRHYQDGTLFDAVNLFARRRFENIDWLLALRAPDWSRIHEHPRFGRMSAAEMLANWAAHDALHARQIIKRRYQLINREAGDFSTQYAGEWVA